MFISVIICAHNPRREYLERVLVGLKNQSLDTNSWELILVDNASHSVLNEQFDLSWHPHSKHIREEQLGLTAARLCGIKESKGDLIIFVDDDNILRSNYLEAAFGIYQDWPILGAWGGRVIPEFEIEPPAWTKHYWVNLAIREFDKDQWGNMPHRLENLPCGAGLCLRKCVADKYVEIASNSSSQLLLGRKGKSLVSGEDTVIVLTACDMGYGIGMFTALELVHIIPPTRLEENYLIKLEEGLHYSGAILNKLQGREFKSSWKSKILKSLKFILMSPRERRFQIAANKGAKLGLQALEHSVSD